MGYTTRAIALGDMLSEARGLVGSSKSDVQKIFNTFHKAMKPEDIVDFNNAMKMPNPAAEMLGLCILSPYLDAAFTAAERHPTHESGMDEAVQWEALQSIIKAIAWMFGIGIGAWYLGPGVKSLLDMITSTNFLILGVVTVGTFFQLIPLIRALVTRSTANATVATEPQLVAQATNPATENQLRHAISALRAATGQIRGRVISKVKSISRRVTNNESMDIFEDRKKDLDFLDKVREFYNAYKDYMAVPDRQKLMSAIRSHSVTGVIAALAVILPIIAEFNQKYASQMDWIPGFLRSTLFEIRDVEWRKGIAQMLIHALVAGGAAGGVVGAVRGLFTDALEVYKRYRKRILKAGRGSVAQGIENITLTADAVPMELPMINSQSTVSELEFVLSNPDDNEVENVLEYDSDAKALAKLLPQVSDTAFERALRIGHVHLETRSQQTGFEGLHPERLAVAREEYKKSQSLKPPKHKPDESYSRSAQLSSALILVS